MNFIIFMEKAVIITLFFLSFETQAAISAKTGQLMSTNNAIRAKCVEEIAKTDQNNGPACQKYLQSNEEYQAHFKKNECPGNKSHIRCTASEDELKTRAEKLLQESVAEKKKELAPKETVETPPIIPPKQTVQTPSATESKDNIEVVGMITTNPSSQPSGSTRISNNQSSVSLSSSSSINRSTGFKSSSGNPSQGLFGDLLHKGAEIFIGLREIIYAVAGFGILAVAIGGFFGAFNWKWLVSIAIALTVISLTSAIINYMVGEEVISSELITDTLISAN